MLESWHRDSSTAEFETRFRGLLAAWGCDENVADILGCDIEALIIGVGDIRQPAEIALARLAKYWGVTPGYLAGQPGAEKEPRAVTEAKARLTRYLAARKQEFEVYTVARRLRVVMDFLAKAVPTYYTRAFVARWLHLSPASLDEILGDKWEMGGCLVQRFAQLCGIHERWFYGGDPDLRAADETSAVSCIRMPESPDFRPGRPLA